MLRSLPAVLPALILMIVTTSHARQAGAPAGLRIEDFEKVALEKNPAIARAKANIEAARGRARQAGLYPNPMVGITADEVNTGPIIRGGEIGFFVQQDIVLGGKLSKSRSTLEQETARTEAESEGQRLRVLNDVRAAFYQTLAAQRKVDVRTRLMELVKEAVAVSGQLKNVGQADLPDVLQIEVEEQRAELALMQARNELDQRWRQLAAAVGDPAMTPRPLAGDLEQLPELELEPSLSLLLRDSPQVKVAQADVRRAEAALDRARVEKIPNLDILGGLRYNRELLEVGQRPVGLEGFFDVGVRIPLFDRNQGGVQAARAEVTSAERNVERVQLALRSRLAVAFREYLDAREAAMRYQTAMLPRAQRAYDLYLISFRQMAASYPQALIAQRTLFQLQDEYNDTLAIAWTKATEIRGLLLMGLDNMESVRPNKGR
jgi:cobalt-zinc-cadmium efflux system outer membrane protein